MASIETGVDRLVNLIKEKKKITVADAAKLLGVSKTVLQEWADFLQEEKVIDIDYKLTNTWLIEKKLTEEEILSKKSEFESLKGNFIRKAESAIESVDSQTARLSSIKSEFEKVKKEVSLEFDRVQHEVKELETFENLKRGIDQEIINQQAEFRNSIKLAHDQLLDEEKRYQNLVVTIDKEKSDMKKEKADIDSLKAKEDDLNSKLGQMKNIIEDIHKQIEEHNSKISYTKESIKNLEKSADKIEQIIIQKRNALDPLLQKSKEHEKKIEDAQSRLLAKVVEKKQVISQTADEGRQVIEKFKKFFEKKAQLDMLLMKIEEEKVNLKAELNSLVKKAKMYDLMSSGKSSDKHINELKIAMDNVEKKKEGFKQEISRLLSLVTGK